MLYFLWLISKYLSKQQVFAFIHFLHDINTVNVFKQERSNNIFQWLRNSILPYEPTFLIFGKSKVKYGCF